MSDVRELRENYNLAELHRRTLRVLGFPLLVLSYLAIGWVFFQHATFTWQHLSPALLAVGTGASLLLSAKHLRVAIVIYVFSLVASSLSYAFTGGFSLAPYFAVCVVLLTGVLLGPLQLLLVTLCMGGGLAIAARIRLPGQSLPPEVLYALIALGITTLSSWLASRNLYTTLGWAWESYNEARQQREQARERQAQLALALRGLDEAASRLQRMNYELNRARDAAEDARSLQQHFTASVSHELRTPLALIAGFSEMIYLSPASYGTPLPAEYVGDVREIYRNSQHLLSLIDDILTISQLKARKLHLRRQEVDLRQVLRDATDSVRPLIEGKGITLVVDVDRAPASAYVDPGRIRQVLINLLTNAYRFTEQGQVSVCAETQDDQVQISVSDTGIGIAPTEQENAFQAFRQLASSERQPLNGVGLGLAISKDFVDMHGGSIWVESRGIPGEGTTFYFTIPFNLRSEVVKPELRRTPDSPFKALSLADAKPSVLLVSHDSQAIGALEKRLIRYHFETASNLASLPNLVREISPLAVVLNPLPGQEMAQFDDVCQWLGDSDVPVVLCPIVTKERQAQSMGVQAYLLKPVTRDIVLSALKDLDRPVRRLLIVDDDLRFVRLLARILRSADQPYELLRAYAAREALEQLRNNEIDAVLLDLLMPDVEGTTLLDWMRQDPRLANIPVIIITSREYDQDDSRRAGGRYIHVTHRWGLGKEQSIRYLGAILDTITSGKPSEPEE
jgi:signal transduction histidine kinase/CheY-like chemotaxis protein